MAAGDGAPVILLPGGVTPAAIGYADLLAALGPETDVITKDLELYAGDAPPASHGLDDEVTGLLRTIDAAGHDRVHLVGFSGGGAVALAFLAAHPQRVLSLALIEPAWVGNDGWEPEERAYWEQLRSIMRRPPGERMPAFVAWHLPPGVEPPPPPADPPPPWMASRPDGLAALTRAFDAYDLDMAALRRWRGPVLYALGGRSNPMPFRTRADRLGGVFDEFTLDVYDERHHFDPPHRAEAARFARSLRGLWSRAQR